MAFFDCGGVRLMMSLPAEKGDAAGQSFAIDHLLRGAPTFQEARRCWSGEGCSFESAPHVVARLPHADLWMGFLRDPDGNAPGDHERGRPSGTNRKSEV
jgi:hypothetical protein